eukprot:TRINITY_DN37290_c0_g1_i1.p2 TRINITY_DN37290_c0_g1~~TRINITY_DN37290_c0_g1_i1.p2  ORF type:complete len:471 (+),score=138.72 TRINITY_DN37290_c0_g1_i1:79-1413(+)
MAGEAAAASLRSVLAAAAAEGLRCDGPAARALAAAADARTAELLRAAALVSARRGGGDTVFAADWLVATGSEDAADAARDSDGPAEVCETLLPPASPCVAGAAAGGAARRAVALARDQGCSAALRRAVGRLRRGEAAAFVDWAVTEGAAEPAAAAAAAHAVLLDPRWRQSGDTALAAAGALGAAAVGQWGETADAAASGEGEWDVRAAAGAALGAALGQRPCPPLAPAAPNLLRRMAAVACDPARRPAARGGALHCVAAAGADCVAQTLLRPGRLAALLDDPGAGPPGARLAEQDLLGLRHAAAECLARLPPPAQLEPAEAAELRRCRQLAGEAALPLCAAEDCGVALPGALPAGAPPNLLPWDCGGDGAPAAGAALRPAAVRLGFAGAGGRSLAGYLCARRRNGSGWTLQPPAGPPPRKRPRSPRSQERRVGKECRSRWWPDH